MSKKDSYPGLVPATQETAEHISNDCEIAGRAGADSESKSIENITKTAKKTGKAIADAGKSVGNKLKKAKIKHMF